MRATSIHTSIRWLAVLSVLALLAVACGGADEEMDDAAAAQAQAQAAAAQAEADAAQAALAQAQADLEAAQATAAEAMEGDDAAQAELAAALAEAEAALDEAEMAAAEAMMAAEEAEAAAAEEAAATTMPEEEEVAEAGPFTYKLAIFSDPTTDNPWAYLDTEADVWNQYVLTPAIPTLYGSAFPSYTVVPNLAADVEPPLGSASGDNWVIDVNMRQGLVWSDGSPITANDVAFTFNAVKDLEMGGNWFSLLPLAREDDPATEENEGAEGLISVEAVDDYTVRYTWSSQPGLAQWQFGAAQAAVFSEAHWGPHVAASGDAGELYAVSGEGAPSGGSMVFDRREPGAFARSVANANANDQGAQTTSFSSGGVTFSGDVSWQVGDTSGEVIADSIAGPHAGDAIYSVYDTQDAAVLALRDGEVDFMLNPLGLQRGLQSTVLEAGDLDVIANSSNGFRYLAFNTRRFPGSDVAFRQAVACMIDKEFMATNVLQGVAIPLNSMVPPGNAFWANPELDAWCAGQSQEERLNSAVQILKDAGWTWDVEPQWNPDNRDVIPKGLGQRPRDTADGGAHRLLGDRGQGVRSGGLGHVHPRMGSHHLPRLRSRLLRLARRFGHRRRVQHPRLREPGVRRDGGPVEGGDRHQRGRRHRAPDGRGARRGRPVRDPVHHPGAGGIPQHPGVPQYHHSRRLAELLSAARSGEPGPVAIGGDRAVGQAGPAVPPPRPTGRMRTAVVSRMQL